jgi:hypothetical protein
MKNRFTGLGIFAGLMVGLLVSCASTGQFLPSAAQEQVIGNVQTAFETHVTWFNNNAINTQAYIRLLETAGKNYSGNIDVRDIVWVTGKAVDGQNKEIVATGKVIEVK